MNRRKHKKSRTTQLLTMDELRARPCEVDGRPALFHRWIEEDDALLRIPSDYKEITTVEMILGLFKRDHIVTGDCEVVVAHHTFALVEYRNGTIAKVDPERVQFTGKEGQT